MPKTPLTPDDLKIGQLVAIHSFKEQNALFQGEFIKVTPQNNEFCGEPIRIRAICLPYIAGIYIGSRLAPNYPLGTTIKLDIRNMNLMQITPAYALAIGGVILTKSQSKKEATRNEFIDISPMSKQELQETQQLKEVFSKIMKDAASIASNTPATPTQNPENPPQETSHGDINAAE